MQTSLQPPTERRAGCLTSFGSSRAVACRLAAWLLLFLGLAPSLAARPRQMRFEHLSIEQGLSQSFVNCILQDSKGFLWLGTQSGLNRYDGYGFEVYRHDAEDPGSLPHDWILALLDDPSGDLWIGTEGGGLARWHRATDSFTVYRHDPSDPASLSGDWVVAMAWDPSGALWVGTRDSGLNRLDPATGKFRRFRHDPADPGSLASDKTFAVYADRAGMLWVGTAGGLGLFDPAREAFVHYRHDPADPGSLSDDRVRAIVEDSTGNLWVGTHGGLNRLTEDFPGRGGRGPAQVFERFLHDPDDPSSLSHNWVRSLFEDRDGRLWVGTDGGLNLWQEASGGFAGYRPDPGDPTSLNNGQIVSIYQDRGGVLWIGTIGGGANRWNPGTWSFPLYASDEAGASNTVFSMSEDETGDLWIGTFGGLDRLDRAAGRRQRYTHDPRDASSLSDDRVTALLHDRAGTLWVGTVGGGLNRLQERRSGAESETFERYLHDPENPQSLSANAVATLFEDRRGRLWIGTIAGGLDLYHEDGTFTSFRHDPYDDTSLGNDRVFSLAEDRGGRLWLATDGGGLNRLHPATGAFLRLVHRPELQDSLASNELITVHVDAAGRLWAGTKGSGLDLMLELDETTGRGTFRNYSRADGLPDETIWGIRSDLAGDLWLATNNGLARLDPETGEVKTYSTSHGLQSNEFNQGAHFASPNGELFFGGVNGFNAFFPDRLQTSQEGPPVVLTSFTKVNQPVRFERPLFDVDEIELGYRDYYFSFEIAALDFTAPRENRYRYMLEGFDADWVDLGHRRRVTFTNLDAGHYTLRVEGSNHDGGWNRQGASVRLAIAPPPWQTWWAYGLYALTLAGVVGAFVRHQHHKVELERAIANRERRQSEERRHLLLEREDLIEELEAKNSELERFNYTVSHDLKSPLVTIKGFLGLLEKDAVGGNVERLRHDIRRIGSAADRMRRLLDELLELSKLGRQVEPPELVPLRPLAAEALELVSGQVAERGAEVKIDRDLPRVFGERLRLLQLYQNLLANAVKYMGEQSVPRVEVGVRYDDDGSGSTERVLFVSDNGMGIDERYQEKVFGLFERLDADNEGTGIGLALAKRIVEMHGGRIWVESEGPGRGSTFCFTLAGNRLEEPEGQPEPEGTVVEASERFRKSSSGV
ncbi:MAG: hypothetical protein GY719_24000 [bacterium]|nr:hypothetical protein [bacterium]